MTTRLIATTAFVGGCLFLSWPVAAQSPPATVPATVDLTCHGYDEGATRAYNCIPPPHLQHLLRTFVPPPGARCDQGGVEEFPPGRIVFQIRCQDTGGGTTTPAPPAGWSASGRGPSYFTKPINVVRVRIESRFSGRGGNFIVWCRAPANALIVNELIGIGFGNEGTVGVYRMAQCTDVEVDTEQNASWTFTQEGGTAFTPKRSWMGVTGAGGDMPIEALAALATAVELEREAGR